MAGIAWLVPPPRTGFAPPRARSAPPPARPPRFHRTIFISDIHLGTRGCKAEFLCDFLAKNACETLYLIGNILPVAFVCYFVQAIQKNKGVAELKRIPKDFR